MFHIKNQELFCEAVSLAEIGLAVGTPVYIYSQAELLNRARAFLTAVPPENSLITYALKANSNPALIRLLGENGFGADVTSGGELFLAHHAGISPEKIIYSGVGKRRDEIEMALDLGVRALHVESEMELHVIADVVTERQTVADIGVRVNPDIQVETHPYMSTGLKTHKFGVSPETAVSLLHFAREHPLLNPVGLATHIGSQITAVEPFRQSANFLVTMAEKLAINSLRLEYLDVGGGLGIDYHTPIANTPTSQYPHISEWVTAVTQPILNAGYEVVLEPGRSLVGPTGVLLTQVVYTKRQADKQFVIVDAGMNDLLRPTLYDAYHPILPLRLPGDEEKRPAVTIVGPICETGDWLARDRELAPLQPGDFLAIMQAGAYGFVMSSNYNGRLRPAEWLVNGDQCSVIRSRQDFTHLLDGCQVPE